MKTFKIIAVASLSAVVLASNLSSAMAGDFVQSENNEWHKTHITNCNDVLVCGSSHMEPGRKYTVTHKTTERHEKTTEKTVTFE